MDNDRAVRIGVIQFPGSNCERETMLAIERAGMEPVPHLWNAPKALLADMHGFVIVGGFSYEDRSRAGVIAAHDPLLEALLQASEQGKPILGICNGAQILVEAGLVPGVSHHQLALALTDNQRLAQGKVLGTGYYNAWVHMRLSDQYQRNMFTRHLTPKTILRVPVAHAEGRFVMPAALRDEVTMQGLNVFQYCDVEGHIVDHFPINPNGSMDNMAALSNKRGNVLAMMPHPERTVAGDAIFLSMRDAILEAREEQVVPLYYMPRPIDCPRYQKPVGSHEWIVELMITDNQAWTVQNTFRQLGLPVSVRRYVHWEIECDGEETLKQIKASDVLYCARKERLCNCHPERLCVIPSACVIPSEVEGSRGIAIASRSLDCARDDTKALGMTVSPGTTLSLLIRAKEDIIGKQKQQTLSRHFDVTGINAITHGILWCVTAEQPIDDFMKRILHTCLLGNPYAHDYTQYL